MEITEIGQFWGLGAWNIPRNHLKFKFGRTPPAAPADVIHVLSPQILVFLPQNEY